MTVSEFRAYGFILDSLSELGWDKRAPTRGGQIFTQNEVRRDSVLKDALGNKRPENVVLIGNNPRHYWVIEAKRDFGAKRIALDEAYEYANLINEVAPLSCRMATAVVGDTDDAHLHLIETHFLSTSGNWRAVTINGKKSTGFLSPEQTRDLVARDTWELRDYDIDEDLFRGKTDEINRILHYGGVNKRNRAMVLASLLLAIAHDPNFQAHSDPKTLIQDINTRARSKLKEYGKDNFFGEIEIHLPTSDDNHVKHKRALVDTIDILLGLNIASAIDSGRDVLGRFYEDFLKYANDAKEIGIVLTPRHITTFGANVADVQPSSVVFDPACGTGGFLVAALDKVKSASGTVDQFREGNLYGIEQDPLIATLAIVNMIFRGDGSSNIQEGDGLKKAPQRTPDRCLMNPPFALDKEYEWKFVDRALKIMEPGGLLFAVVPTSMMMSANNDRNEITWRTEMLKHHTLLAVVKLPEDLFYPHVSKGTCGILIRACQPHNEEEDVFWACLHDGIKRTKTARAAKGNLEQVERALRHFVTTGQRPEFVHGEVDCAPIRADESSADFLDLAPENHIGRNTDQGRYDLGFIFRSMSSAKERLRASRQVQSPQHDDCRPFFLTQFVRDYEKGRSGRGRDLRDGALPLISTSETNNGISSTVDPSGVHKIYSSGLITVSSNGGSCCAFYHDYEFAANPDVFVLFLHDEYQTPDFSMFLCAAINNESWRYNYFRKFNQTQLESLTVQMPALKNGQIDANRISQIIRQAKPYDPAGLDQGNV